MRSRDYISSAARVWVRRNTLASAPQASIFSPRPSEYESCSGQSKKGRAFMHANAAVLSQHKTGVWPAVFWGGLISGTLDLTYIMTFYAFRGVPFQTIPHAIASGLLGMKSFEGGWPTAILGIAFEYVITFVATLVYYLASRKLTFLIQRVAVFGVLYGIAIYFFMHDLVVPLSAAPKFQHTPLTLAVDFIGHMIVIGPPMALAVKKYSQLNELECQSCSS
jgi:hypothetical protein